MGERLQTLEFSASAKMGFDLTKVVRLILLARRPLLNSFAVPAYVRLVIRHVVLWLLPASALLFAQAGNQSALRLDTGEHIYKSACVACHGPDGRGTPKTIAGFEPPDSFPDFTRCDQTTPEPNTAWEDVIMHGGPSRGFSQIMPAFGDALNLEQISKVIEYMRSEEHTSELQSQSNLVCRLLLEKKKPEIV